MESDNQTDTSLQCSDCSITKKNCCSEESETIKGQDELHLSFDKSSFDQQIFIAVFIYYNINLFEGTEFTKVPFVEYPPPFFVRDLQVLHQTFLI